MNEKLYIPKKLNVGFQLRKDCFTGRLGYVVYWDDKGKLRKENSWESWRSKPEDGPKKYNHEKRAYELSGKPYGERVSPLELENIPTEGFVLNKDVGGVRSSWGWNDRLEKVRVYDPRDFEFEISIPNLLYILQECSSIKGKGLEGEFVYSWSGTELVLLPISSKEYKECVKFTELQAESLSKKDLIPGNLYMDKNQEIMVYIGKDFFISSSHYGPFKLTKTHIFSEVSGKYFTDSFKPVREVGKCDNFAFIMDEFKRTDQGSCIKEIVMGDFIQWKESSSYYRHHYDPSYGYGFHKKGEIYSLYHLIRAGKKGEGQYLGDFKLKNGIFEKISGPKRNEDYSVDTSNLSLQEIKFVLDNGSEYPYSSDYDSVKAKIHQTKTKNRNS